VERLAAPILIALAGLAFGSFLNVCVTRIPRRESIVAPGSHCPACRHPLSMWQNLPLLGWILLGGRCHWCRRPIGLRYPLVELAVALLWLAVWQRTPALGPGLTAVYFLPRAVFCWLLTGLAATDAETLLLPHAFTLPGMALGVAAAPLLAGLRLPGTIPLLGPHPGAALDGQSGAGLDAAVALGHSLLGSLMLAAMLMVIRTGYSLVRRRVGLGLGDVTLMAMIGAWLGLAGGLLALFLGVLTATAWAALLLLAAGRGAEAGESWGLRRLPLGTFLCAGAVVSLFCGDRIVSWYLGLF
jgi:leader peptidase (prepilin peptidase)/N-methyltransferase